MTYNHFEKIFIDVAKTSIETTKYFHIEKDVIPFFEENWESLTSQPRRKTSSWHASLIQILSKESAAFKQNPENPDEVALRDRNLLDIGPMLDSVKQLGRRPPATQPIALVEADLKIDEEGPKTRGASKRKNVENTTLLTSIKKTKSVVDFSSVEVEGIDGLVDFPFNREGYRYYQVEKDEAVNNRELFEKEDVGNSEPIPSHVYRIKLTTIVTLSPNDGAHQFSFIGIALFGGGLYATKIVKTPEDIVNITTVALNNISNTDVDNNPFTNQTTINIVIASVPAFLGVVSYVPAFLLTDLLETYGYLNGTHELLNKHIRGFLILWKFGKDSDTKLATRYAIFMIIAESILSITFYTFCFSVVFNAFRKMYKVLELKKLAVETAHKETQIKAVA